ncbi:MAG TPA: GMC family oxidoreductase [Candidatus Binatia bacterium]|nr:GMC family oxidoreductase [Candidatus Binatia bacterium]
MAQHYDVIVIGSGAGGGSLAHRLASSGKKILILERGHPLPREKDNWDARSVQIDGRYNPTERWRDRDGNPFQPGVKYFVGGNTKVWGAATLRLRPDDFGVVRHEGGISPRWPIGYDELEPYYTQAEHLWRVRGARGVDPTEGPASRPYRHPPIRHEPRIAQLVHDFERAGVRAWNLPLALLLDESRGDGDACIRCDTCDGFPCLVRGKADAEVICVAPALRHHNVSLLTGARVTRLATSASGREVTEVHVEREGVLETYRADVVAVACGAINSAALLLRSANERHPDGLGNRSGHLGRHYMAHQNSAVFALSREENRSVLQKTFAISDFYRAGNGLDYPLGLIQPLNRTPAVLLEHSPPGIAGHGPEHLASHSLEFWITTEDLPLDRNRVRLGRDGEIVVEYTPNNTVPHRKLTEKLAAVLGKVEGDGFSPDAHFRAERMPLSVCSHQCGTMRFGDDPRDSVLNRDCRLHEVENLYVVDASFFPSSGAVNPTLTIIANALRVGDRLLERL